MMANPSTAQLVVRLFGYPQIERDGAIVRVSRHKTAALLSYLAVTGSGHGRPALAALLWPDYDAEQAGAYLRYALWELRKAMGDAALEVDRDTLALRQDPHLTVDVVRFSSLIAAWRADPSADPNRLVPLLDEAVTLYRDDFLSGFTLSDSPAYDEWQFLQSEHLRQELGRALVALARAYMDLGDYALAIPHVRRWLAAEPLDEAHHLLLMQLYAWTGQRNAALRQYQVCCTALRDELGARPQSEITTLYRQIRAGEVRPREKMPFVSPLPAAGPSDVEEAPRQSAPLIGREEDMERLSARVANADCRLLTLVGPGGIGKTSLALAVARVVAPVFRDGTRFVALAGATSREQAISAVADALDVPSAHLPGLGAGRLPDQVMDYLRGREMLIVLDNLEHLVTEADMLSHIIARAPGIKLLATSRQRLNVRDEWVYEVGPLDYVVTGAENDMTSLPAARLFLWHARRVKGDLTVRAVDHPAIEAICRHIEGMPLGIELAATWMRMLSCHEIAAQLEAGADFLESNQQDVPERHRSLRRVYEQSWKLLTAGEQSAYARLAVFGGGFEAEAAAQVAQASLSVLARLLDKCMLSRDTTGRYRLHQVMRQYAQESLAAFPEWEAVARNNHSAYYLNRLYAAGQDLMYSGYQEPLLWLETEGENVRLAWAHAVRQGDLERVRRALPACILGYEMRGRAQDALSMFRPAIDRIRGSYPDTAENPQLAGLLALLLAAEQHFTPRLAPGDGPVREQQSVAMARWLPDGQEKAFVYLLNSTGTWALPTDEGQALCEESGRIFGVLQHDWGLAMSYLIWADYASFGKGQAEAAQLAYDTAKRLFCELGNRWGQALCVTGLAHVAATQAQYEKAMQWGLEALAVFDECGDLGRSYSLRVELATVARTMSDPDTAYRLLEESLRRARTSGNRAIIAHLLAHMGRLMAQQGVTDYARSLLEQSLALYRELGHAEGTRHTAALLAEIPP